MSRPLKNVKQGYVNIRPSRGFDPHGTGFDFVPQEPPPQADEKSSPEPPPKADATDKRTEDPPSES